jgi:predicted O-methyltransferase YrrM
VDVRKFGLELATRMKEELPKDTVVCRPIETYGMLAEMVHLSGDGNYVEIGTWRGTSAIIAAKTKQEYGLGGGIFCVDHFRGYTGTFIGTDDALANFKRYGVDHMISIKIAESRPFPLNGKFECAFIDGDHWDLSAYLDFTAIEKQVNRFVLFDDWNDLEGHTVPECVSRVLNDYKNWKVRDQINGACIMLERTQ